MTVKLDEHGALVLSKQLQEELGLRPGDEIDLIKTPECIELRPRPTLTGRLMQKGPLLVWHSDQPTPAVDINQEIDCMREERTDQILGIHDQDAG